MRILKKIGFQNDLLCEIEKSAKNKNLDFTKEVNRLCKVGLESDYNKEELYNIKKEIKDIKRLVLYINDMQKQIFANLDLENVDVKNSKRLKEYYRGKDNDKFNN